MTRQLTSWSRGYFSEMEDMTTWEARLYRLNVTGNRWQQSVQGKPMRLAWNTQGGRSSYRRGEEHFVFRVKQEVSGQHRREKTQSWRNFLFFINNRILLSERSVLPVAVKWPWWAETSTCRSLFLKYWWLFTWTCNYGTRLWVAAQHLIRHQLQRKPRRFLSAKKRGLQSMPQPNWRSSEHAQPACLRREQISIIKSFLPHLPPL